MPCRRPTSRIRRVLSARPHSFTFGRALFALCSKSSSFPFVFSLNNLSPVFLSRMASHASQHAVCFFRAWSHVGYEMDSGKSSKRQRLRMRQCSLHWVRPAGLRTRVTSLKFMNFEVAFDTSTHFSVTSATAASNDLVHFWV